MKFSSLKLITHNYLFILNPSLNFIITVTLKNIRIIVFPDKGCYKKWKQISEKLNSKGFLIEVSNLLENSEYTVGCDLADIMKLGS